MPGPGLFLDVRLNFAESLSPKVGVGTALVFWGEDKVKRRLSRAELARRGGEAGAGLGASCPTCRRQSSACLPLPRSARFGPPARPISGRRPAVSAEKTEVQAAALTDRSLHIDLDTYRLQFLHKPTGAEPKKERGFPGEQGLSQCQGGTRRRDQGRTGIGRRRLRPVRHSRSADRGGARLGCQEPHRHIQQCRRRRLRSRPAAAKRARSRK